MLAVAANALIDIAYINISSPYKRFRSMLTLAVATNKLARATN